MASPTAPRLSATRRLLFLSGSVILLGASLTAWDMRAARSGRRSVENLVLALRQADRESSSAEWTSGEATALRAFLASERWRVACQRVANGDRGVGEALGDELEKECGSTGPESLITEDHDRRVGEYFLLASLLAERGVQLGIREWSDSGSLDSAMLALYSRPSGEAWARVAAAAKRDLQGTVEVHAIDLLARCPPKFRLKSMTLLDAMMHDGTLDGARLLSADRAMALMRELKAVGE